MEGQRTSSETRTSGEYSRTASAKRPIKDHIFGGTHTGGMAKQRIESMLRPREVNEVVYVERCCWMDGGKALVYAVVCQTKLVLLKTAGKEPPTRFGYDAISDVFARREPADFVDASMNERSERIFCIGNSRNGDRRGGMVASFSVGDRVTHGTRGDGTIVDVNMATDKPYTVSYNNGERHKYSEVTFSSRIMD